MSSGKRGALHRDLALGLVMLALAIGYYTMAAALPETTLADAVGPQGLPQAYAVVLGVLALILIAQAVASGRQPGAASPAGRAAESEARVPVARIAGMLLIGVLYIAVVPYLGYLLSLAVLIAATTYYQGGRLDRRVAVTAGSGALLFWVLFVWVLRIPQPAGVWPSFL